MYNGFFFMKQNFSNSFSIYFQDRRSFDFYKVCNHNKHISYAKKNLLLENLILSQLAKCFFFVQCCKSDYSFHSTFLFLSWMTSHTVSENIITMYQKHFRFFNHMRCIFNKRNDQSK